MKRQRLHAQKSYLYKPEMKKYLVVLFLCLVEVCHGQDIFQYGRGAEKGKLWIKEPATGDVTIPSKVMIGGEECEIVEVLAPYKNKVRRLTLPNTVKRIYLGNCKELEEIELPNSLEEIEGSCFSDLKNLKRITIPNSVRKIGSTAFSGSGLIEITLPNSLHEIERMTFYDCKDLVSVTIPNSITSIGESAFGGCSSLSRVNIPNGITSIEEGVFFNCSSLINITIPNSITSIDKSAFSGSGLTEITLPNSVKYLGESAFRGCKSLKKLTLGNSLQHIGRWAIDGPMEELIIPNTVTEFGPHALNCDRVKYLVVPDKEVETKGDGIGDNKYHPISYLDNLEAVSGHNEVLPQWVIPYIDKHSPFAKQGMKPSYTYYAKARIGRIIEKWQQKGEFETTAQWKARVTEEKRNAIVSTEMPKIRAEYISKYKPDAPKCVLGTYDADENFFPVNIEGKEQQTLYIKVPLGDAQRFKQGFSSAAITPTYGIVNDEVAATNYKCVVSGKNYTITNTYAKDNSSDIALNLPPLELDFGDKQSDTPKGKSKTVSIDNSIDKNIPLSTIKNGHTFAVIIGNEDYAKVSKVQFAHNDARSFAEYCKKTLGLPEKNVRGYEDATYGTLVSAVKDIQKIAEAYKGEANIIFYYAGHGIPDNASKDAYLLPVDADGRQMDICYSLSKLYQTFGAMNVKSVTVFLDACFSGAVRGEGMLTAARGVAIKARPTAPQGKMVVFSAATDGQTAFPYAEKGHGMFTYFLLKKLRDTKGEVTLGELGNYIKDEVTKQAIVVNGREQTPTVSCSQIIQGNWRNMKLK